jgi:hypothetical protein
MGNVESPAMKRVLGLVLLALVSSCEKASDDAKPPHEDWIVESRVVFVEADRRTPRKAPKEPLRLWMPYVVGDLYGSPNAGEIAPVSLRRDLSFTLNLNLGHRKLGRALVPTGFSQKWMMIEPKEARIARHSPWVMPTEGIAPIGRCEWLDADSGARLLLIYVDRPARIRGEIVYEGRSLNFDIDAKQAGYLWVTQPEESGEYRVVPRPARLVLAVMP